jgi:nitrite reductase/ring-hydroxylating ferredoxin subunit
MRDLHKPRRLTRDASSSSVAQARGAVMTTHACKQQVAPSPGSFGRRSLQLRAFSPVVALDGTPMHRVDVAGEAVLITRSTSGEICAIANTCSRCGGPLAQGEREGDVVVCPWHGSRFDVCTGDVVGGPAVFPQPSFEARARGGKVELRRAG